MSKIGIIAEYNPYHNGHKYLLETAYEKTGADQSIAIMSGNFMQRGTPAMADKYTRAEAAVLGGIDAVFELPVIYATGSSRDFGNGAVAILDALKCIDYLAFGAEDDDEKIFDEISHILASEPEGFKRRLNSYLSKGISFPAANQKAIQEMLGETASDVMTKPNNTLAISYMTALRKINSSIKPVIIKRISNDYNNTKLTGTHSSAAAIREAIANNTDITPYVPKETAKAYTQYINKQLPVSEWLTPYINSRLIYDRNLEPTISNLDKVMDMSEEFLNRLRKAPFPIKYVELADYLKTKNITMTRVSRVLIHMILGILEEDRTLTSEYGMAQYANLLAFKKEKSDILKTINENSPIPIINKKSVYEPANECASRLWQIDKLATDFYNQLVYENTNIRLHNELTCKVRTV